MRKKLLALVCAVAAALQLCLPASAAETVYFTAANETIRELTEATMPFWANGVLYVEGSIFENKDLYTGYFYNSAKNMAVVYSRKTANYALYFDMAANRVDDADGQDYSLPAIARNGVIFLPAKMVAEFFQLTYVSTKVNHGSLIRIRSDKAVLNDRTLADAGSPRMEDQYEKYTAAKAAAQQGQSGSGSGASTAKGQTLHLCFRPGEGDLAVLLDLLDGKGAKGTFYLTEEEMTADPDLTRRIAATGHSIGLAVSAESETALAEQLRLANERLWRTAGCKTRLCLVDGGGEEERRGAEEAGYRCLEADIDRSEYGLRSSGAANYLFNLVGGRRGEVTVWFAAGADSVGLRALLRLTEEADDRLSGLTETD